MPLGDLPTTNKYQGTPREFQLVQRVFLTKANGGLVRGTKSINALDLYQPAFLLFQQECSLLTRAQLLL